MRDGFADPTKESKQRARSSLLNAYDDATAQHLNEAEEYGAEIGDMKLTVELVFDKKLGTWEILRLQKSFPVDLPRFPIKRIYGLYSVDDKFWGEGHANLGDPKEHQEDSPDSCECLACESKRGVEWDGQCD